MLKTYVPSLDGHRAYLKSRTHFWQQNHFIFLKPRIWFIKERFLFRGPSSAISQSEKSGVDGHQCGDWRRGYRFRQERVTPLGTSLLVKGLNLANFFYRGPDSKDSGRYRPQPCESSTDNSRGGPRLCSNPTPFTGAEFTFCYDFLFLGILSLSLCFSPTI